MKVRRLWESGAEIQCEVHYCYYDYETDERIEIGVEKAADLDIRYIYCENDELYIEVEKEIA